MKFHTIKDENTYKYTIIQIMCTCKSRLTDSRFKIQNNEKNISIPKATLI